MSPGPAPLRVALIGCGKVARLHAQRLRGMPNVVVPLCIDPNLELATALRNELFPSAQVQREWTGEGWDEPLDLVIISSPTPCHFDQVKHALSRGLHVLCEKPLAGTREEILELCRLTRTTGKLLGVSYQRRFKAPYRTARKLLQDGDRFGTVNDVHIYACERWQQEIVGTWRDDANVSFGYFGDAGTHQIDILSFITGLAPARVSSVSKKCGSQVEIVTSMVAELNNGAGLVAQYVGNAGHWREDIHIHCSRGDLLIRSEELFECRENHIERVDCTEPGSSPDEAMVEAILNRGDNPCPPEIALLTHDWTAAVMRSLAAGGQQVELP